MPITTPLRTLLAATLAAALLLPGDAAAQVTRQRVDTAFTFERGGSVSLSLVSGEIIVRASDRNEIRIVATVERGRLETSFSRSRVSIEAREVSRRVGEARYELTVPVGTRVQAGSVSGDITITGTGAEVDVGTVSGDVRVSDARDVVEVESVGGDLDLSGISGRVEVNTVSGSIRIDDIGGSLDLNSVSAEVDVRRGRLTALSTTSVSGGFTYDGTFARDGYYQMNSHSGTILFSLPANAGAQLDLETWSGHISSDFPLTLQPDGSAGRRARRMQFTIGQGGARISAETFSGNITIRRAGARPQE
jgi:DUF4097 and DUF4098 domain-containing protein YvlB